MCTMQTLVMNHLTAMLKDKHIDSLGPDSLMQGMSQRGFTIDLIASNCGTLRVVDGYTLCTLAEIGFDFQRDGFRFTVPGKTDVVAAHDYGKTPRPGMAPWVYGAPLDALVRVVEYLLANAGLTQVMA